MQKTKRPIAAIFLSAAYLSLFVSGWVLPGNALGDSENTARTQRKVATIVPIGEFKEANSRSRVVSSKIECFAPTGAGEKRPWYKGGAVADTLERLTGLGGPKIIRRKEWDRGYQPRGGMRALRTPTAIVFHDTQGATTPQGLIAAMGNHPDIPYHFAIGADGKIYELRPLNKAGGSTKPGARVPDTGASANDTTIAIAFLGDMRPGKHHPMTDAARNAAYKLTASLGRSYRSIKGVYSHGDAGHMAKYGLNHSISDCLNGAPADFIDKARKIIHAKNLGQIAKNFTTNTADRLS